MRDIRQILKLGILLSISIIIAILAVHKWFSGNTILYYWDALLPFNFTLFKASVYTWQSNIFPGSSGITPSWYMYTFGIPAFSQIFGSLSRSQEFHYVLFIIISIISFYTFIRYLIQQCYDIYVHHTIISAISLLFAVCYALNLYTFYYSYYMFNPQIYLYSLFPLHMLSLIRIFPLDFSVTKNRKPVFWHSLFYMSLFFMIPGFTSYIFFAQYLCIITLYIVFYIFLRNIRILGREAFRCLLFILSILFMNWWWFGPTLLSFRNLYESQATIGTDVYIEPGSLRSGLLNVFRFIGSPMMNNNVFSWTKNYTDSIFFSMPLFAFLFFTVYALYRVRSLRIYRTILYLFVILLVTVFIIKLGNPPLGWLMGYLFKYIPFFGAFRDAFQKAGMFYVFVYLSISAIGAYIFVITLTKYKFKRLTLSLTAFGLLLLCIVQTGPFFLFAGDNIKNITFQHNNQEYAFNAKTQIPKEYDDVRQFLEPLCKGTAVILIPRTSLLSDAVWDTGYSYIGQDILTRLIQCNMISVQLINNDADAFTSVPFEFLQKEEYQRFTSYVTRSNIGYVLVRNDYIPYYYAQWHPVEAKKIIQTLDTDVSYENIYNNSIFTVYRVKSLAEKKNYGFSFTSQVTHTNIPLKTSREMALAQIMTDESPDVQVYLNTKELQTEFSSQIQNVLSVSNCIGCVKIQSSIPDTYKESFITQIKKSIKTMLGRDKYINEPEAVIISRIIIATHTEYLQFIQAIRDNDIDAMNTHMTRYTRGLDTINNQIQTFKGSDFDKNYKYLEFQNFLSAEYGKTNDMLSDEKYRKFLESSYNRKNLITLLFLQKTRLISIQQSTWQTDFDKKTLTLRLDIAKSGDYHCDVHNFSSEIPIRSVEYSDTGVLFGAMSSFSAYQKFEAGSYPVKVYYDEPSQLSATTPFLSQSEYVDIPVPHLSNGDHTLTIKRNTTFPGKVFVALIKGSSDLTKMLEKGMITTANDRFIFIDTIETWKDEEYVKPFSVFSLDSEPYHLIILSLSDLKKGNKDNVELSVSIAKQIRNDDIVVSCITAKTNTLIERVPQPLTVKKITPVKYVIDGPKGTVGQFLTFNQTYHPDWTAYTIVDGKRHTFTHIKNSYANAWYIDEVQSGSITIEFVQQNIFIFHIILSVTLFIVCLYVYNKIIL